MNNTENKIIKEIRDRFVLALTFHKSYKKRVAKQFKQFWNFKHGKTS